MKKFKFIFNLLFSFLLLVGVLNQSVYATESTDLYISTLELEGNSNEYPSGSEIVVYAGVTLSGSASTLKGSKTRVTIPKDWIDPSYNNNKVVKVSPAFSLRQDPVVSSDAENYYIDFLYKPIAAGTIIKIPFIFKTKNVVTPDNSRINIQSQLINNENNVLVTNQLWIVNRSKQSLATHNHDQYYYDDKRENNPSTTPAELDQNKLIGLPVGFRASALGNGLGYYKSKYSKLTVRLVDQDNIVFDPNFSVANKGWGI